MIISLRYSAACTGFVCRSAYLSSLPSWCGTPWRQAWKICATANSIWKTNRLTDKRTDSPSVRLLDGVLTQNRWSPGLYSCSRRDWPRWPVGAARLGSGISLPGLRGPGFRVEPVCPWTWTGPLTWPTPFSRSPGFPVDNACGHCRRRHWTSRLYTTVHCRRPSVSRRRRPAARTWNSLPGEVTSSNSLQIFNSKPKSHLFLASFP